MMMSLDWLDDRRFRIGDIEFVTTGPETGDDDEIEALAIAGSLDASQGRFPLLKSRQLLEYYLELLDQAHPRRIMELGILRGGGVVFLAELALPDQLVAVELEGDRVAALDAYCSERPAGQAVKPYYGVDQADRKAMETIVDAEFGREPIDLVVDDASHLLSETRSSFDLLFPRLAPGGLYVIEDWSWGAFPSTYFELGGTPLAVFIFELLLACSTTRGLIADVDVRWNIATIRRGPAPVDPRSFALADCYHDRWRSFIEVGPSLLDQPVERP